MWEARSREGEYDLSGESDFGTTPVLAAARADLKKNTKMAALNSGRLSESIKPDQSAETLEKIHLIEPYHQQQLKRCCPGSPDPEAPLPKSPCRHTSFSNIQEPETTEMQMEPAPELRLGGVERKDDPEWAVQTHHQVIQSPGQGIDVSTRRKSLRRLTRSRRSLPAIHNPCQALCRSISQSLSEEERLEKLMEASMRLAVEKLQDSLSRTPGASLEALQAQVELLENEWCSLAKELRIQPPSATASDPAMDQVRKTIRRLQDECAAWESLLEKHKSKSDQLARQVEQAEGTGMTLDLSSMNQSSQSTVVQTKPDYQSLLARQQPRLQTIHVVMDTQCKMVQELMSIHDQSQLLMKETSSRLAAQAGFQDLSPDPVRGLLAGTLPSSSSVTIPSSSSVTTGSSTVSS
ncbi:hypothetical protein UPYG_G00096040 [Umbra pygmaea]|uniref:DSN1 n=1 Tax=Umbra pygmaea TaxID=75934 RepID=A0ABD0XFS2_UMBPY